MRKRNWCEYRKVKLSEKLDYSKKELDIIYELPTENLIKLSWENIQEWIRINYELKRARKRISTVEELSLHFTYELRHPLNILYRLVEKLHKCNL